MYNLRTVVLLFDYENKYLLVLGGSAFAGVFTPSGYAALNAKTEKRHSFQHVVKMSQRFRLYWGQVRDDDDDYVDSDDERFC